MLVVWGVISTALFVIGTFIVAYIYDDLSRRKPLFGFFNARETKKIVLYVSHLRIPRGGAVGVDNVQRTFGGSAVPFYEIGLVSLFQRLFLSAIPGVDNMPSVLKKVIISDVDVEVRPSPDREGLIEKDKTIIAFGSPGYNVASKYIEDTLHSLARFVQDNAAIEAGTAGIYSDRLHSFVQRANDGRGNIAYYVAGISAIGSTGAGYFLASRWRYLRAKYGDSNPFCVLLKIDPQNPTKHDIILEKE